jgi:PD-(D/E)XK endonuclease
LELHRAPEGGYIRRSYEVGEIDGIAAYCAELDKCYFIPISEAAGHKQFHLRLAPAKNNQKRLLRSAENYELGAIAQLGERLHGMQEAAGSSPASSTPLRSG